MDDLINKLSKIRSEYNCFNEDEEPYYRALSETIRILSQLADGDTISRQALCEYALNQKDKSVTPNDIMRFPSAQPEQRWIPCSERMPKEDVEVLISYRYKEGEGDTSHTYIDITTYGQMYFGGNKVGDHKNWKAPFEYFESNYEVTAWMPLPEPYRKEDTE